MAKSALIFGYGFIGKAFGESAQAAGYSLSATFRSPERRPLLDALGITAVPAGNQSQLAKAVEAASAILITPAPDDDGCPAFKALSGLNLSGKWIGYLSTTGVYGDRGGGWVFEDSELQPTSVEGQRRVLAETQWARFGAHVFRLPGLYGPGRNVIKRLMDGTARRIHKPDHVFSRLHHDDCATALLASLSRPNPGGIYNLCDDEPAAGDAVLEYAAKLCGLPLPESIAWDDPGLSPAMRRFYRDNKRVSNARAKAILSWQPAYPTYREGLNAIYSSVQSNKSD